jgi:hypothetical protein
MVNLDKCESDQPGVLAVSLADMMKEEPDISRFEFGIGVLTGDLHHLGAQILQPPIQSLQSQLRHRGQYGD